MQGHVLGVARDGFSFSWKSADWQQECVRRLLLASPADWETPARKEGECAGGEGCT